MSMTPITSRNFREGRYTAQQWNQGLSTTEMDVALANLLGVLIWDSERLEIGSNRGRCVSKLTLWQQGLKIQLRIS